MGFLDRIGLGAKLLLAPGVLIVLMLAQGVLAWVSLARQAHELRTVADVGLVRSDDAQKLVEDFRVANGEIYQLLTWVNAEIAAPKISALEMQLRERIGVVGTELTRLQSASDLSAAQQAALQAAAQAVAAYTKTADSIIQLSGDDVSTATLMMTKLEKAAASAHAGLNALRAEERALASAALTRAETNTRQLSWLLAVVLGASLACALGLTWALRRRLLANLRGLRESGELLAQGDLSRPATVNGSDEVAQIASALNTAFEQLGCLISGIKRSAGDVHSGSEAIASGSERLAAQIESQAASLQRTAAALGGVTGGLRQTVEQIGTLDALARSTSERVAAGAAATAAARETMDSIKASSNRISEITAVVDGLAFQTNILALNAAVEAARAGEHGRGFAVVASEVRSLSQRSASAAREIRGLIAASVERVQDGAKRVIDAEASMCAIGGDIRDLGERLSSISAAVVTQAECVAEVNDAVASIDTASQRNAGLVAGSRAEAVSLREQAQSLAGSVARFSVAPAAH